MYFQYFVETRRMSRYWRRNLLVEIYQIPNNIMSFRDIRSDIIQISIFCLGPVTEKQHKCVRKWNRLEKKKKWDHNEFCRLFFCKQGSDDIWAMWKKFTLSSKIKFNQYATRKMRIILIIFFPFYVPLHCTGLNEKKKKNKQK